MKLIVISLIIAAVLIVGTVIMTRSSNPDSTDSGNNVSLVAGKQIIDLRAKGGYSPKNSIAKAGVPTVLRVNTAGTFDCSSAIRIPSLGISQNLPPSGNTEIDLGTPSAGTLQGTCGMGMYRFIINFQS